MWYLGDVGITPIGRLCLAMDDTGLVAIERVANMVDFLQRLRLPAAEDWVISAEKTQSAVRQIQEYLRGERRQFTLPINWERMTPFQRQVLQATLEIPYGETRTYGEIAAVTGRPRAARAVGQAQRANPLPIVIPCHRVVGTDGHLTGYGGREGLARKAWLLRLEGVQIVQERVIRET